MFIVKSKVKEYCKNQKPPRRVSSEFITLLNRKVNELIDYHIHMNGKTTLKP